MNPNRVPGVAASTEYGFRQIMAAGQPIYLPGGVVIDGEKARDPLNTGYLDRLRAGMLMGRISLSKKWAPSVLGHVKAAYAGSTSIKIDSPTAVEVLRRLGTTGTFKVTGPPLTGGTVRTLTATYSAVSATKTGQNEVQTLVLSVAGTAGTFQLRVPKADGTKVWTAAIAYNASAATISTAIDTATGVTAGIVCTGTTPFSTTNTGTFTFSGTGYAAKAFDLIEIDGTSLTSYAGETITRTAGGCAYETATVTALNVDEVQQIDCNIASTGGSIVFRYYDPTLGDWRPVTAAWNAIDATYLAAIQAALDLATGVANGIVATAIPATDTDLGFVLTFSGTGYAGKSHPLVEVTTYPTSTTMATVTRNTAGVDGRFAVGSLIQPVDGSETIRGILGMESGLKVTDDDGTDLDVECRQLISGSGSGEIDASQILNYPAETTVQAWIKAALRAVGSGYTFDDDLAA